MNEAKAKAASRLTLQAIVCNIPLSESRLILRQRGLTDKQIKRVETLTLKKLHKRD